MNVRWKTGIVHILMLLTILNYQFLNLFQVLTVVKFHNVNWVRAVFGLVIVSVPPNWYPLTRLHVVLTQCCWGLSSVAIRCRCCKGTTFLQNMENNRPMTRPHVQKGVNVQFFKPFQIQIGVLKIGFGLVADYYVEV
jgi:hypothetical protein